MTEQAPTPASGEAEQPVVSPAAERENHSPSFDLHTGQGAYGAAFGQASQGAYGAAFGQASQGAAFGRAGDGGRPWSHPVPAPPPPPRDGWHRSARVEPVADTPFGVVHLSVPPVTSGLAVSSLVTGLVAVGVSLLVTVLGLAGAKDGWGAWAAGAFAAVGVLAGAAGIVLGMLGLRQVRRAAPPPAVRFTGRGLAQAGLSCGAIGLALTLLGLGIAVLLQLG